MTHSTTSNSQIASQLGQLAALLRSHRANRFKVRAYRNAAEAVRRYPRNISSLVSHGVVPKIPGVGPSISSAIVEIVHSGGLRSIRRHEVGLPPGTAAIAEAAGVSIHEAKRLVKSLKIGTPEELKTNLADGDLERAVGERLAFKVRQRLGRARRLLWYEAHDLSTLLERAIGGLAGVQRVEAAGSLRRGKETVGTLRFVVSARRHQLVRDFLKSHGGVDSVADESASGMGCILAAGPMLRIRFAEAQDWGDAMAEETGSVAHLAQVKRVTGTIRPPTARSEEDWYEARGLPWIPPELRENRGEVEAAKRGALPGLVQLQDIRGDLHAHTTESDGADTLEEMVGAAKARGYSYLAITDHSKSLRITNGLSEERLRRQMEAIDRLNRRLKGFRIFKGSEVDILEDGSLDFDDAVLKDLDIVMASVHSRFALGRVEQTARVLRAIANPYVTCIGHLTGRKLLQRPGYTLDLDRVLRAAKQHGKLLEINASPDRLDIDDALAKQARDLGIPLLVNTDAHSIREMDLMVYGVQQARRGWQSPDTVVNTWDLAAVIRRLRATRSRGAGVRPAPRGAARRS